jgi:hypothetical protein
VGWHETPRALLNRIVRIRYIWCLRQPVNLAGRAGCATRTHSLNLVGTRFSRQLRDRRKPTATSASPRTERERLLPGIVVTAHSADDLGDQLDESLAWRRVEMQSIKSALQDAAARSSSSPLTRALARSIVAMTYAHWEGYTKEVCQAYVKYITRRRPKCAELNDGLLVSLMRHLNRRMTSGDDSARLALIETIRRPEEMRARIPPDTTLVDTKSNLRFDTLRAIFDGLGISLNEFETKANLIDKSLCDMRNEIAHGRNAFPPPEDALVLYAEVLTLMEMVRDHIMAEVRTSGYRTVRDEQAS